MSKQKTIKTTGQFRQYLADLMKQVEKEKISIEKASTITKIAGRINESFYSEILAAKNSLMENKPFTIGKTRLGE